MPYLTGRLIAITEHYAGKHFGFGTFGEMLKWPKRYINVFWRYVNQNDAEVKDIGVYPLERMNTQEQSQALVGYYHERAYLAKKYGIFFGKEETTIEEHVPERIEMPADTDNTIDDLKR